jgi:hypothetical protein
MENPVLEYKNVRYINVYTNIDYDLELKLIDMISKSNFVDKINASEYSHKVVTILVDNNDDIMSISFVDKRYLGPTKLYYFYSTIGNLSDDAEIQLYEITRKSLIEYEKNYADSDYGNFLGIILNKKKDVLISHLNLKSCDTPYPEGTVWYDNFDGTDLII